MNALQLQQLLQQLSSQSRAMETTLSSLRGAVQQLTLPQVRDSRKGPPDGSSSPAVAYWMPLVLAFALGACLGVASARTSSALWRR